MLTRENSLKTIPSNNTKIGDSTLLAAARVGNWEEYDSLVRNGHSPIWLDAESHHSMIYSLAKEDNIDAIIEVLKRTQIDYIVEVSSAIEFLIAESVRGISRNKRSELLAKIDSKILKGTRSDILKRNEMLTDIGNMIISFDEFKDIQEEWLPDTFYHLCSNGHAKTALALASHRKFVIENPEYADNPNVLRLAILSSITRGASSNTQINFDKFVEKLCRVLTDDQDVGAFLLNFEIRTNIKIDTLIEALVYTSAEFNITKHLYSSLKVCEPAKLDIILGNAIIHAASSGHDQLIKDLYEYARVHSIEIPLSLLSQAAGRALICDQLNTCGLLINLAPTIAFSQEDLAVINQWSESKIARVLRVLDDPAVFYEIAQALPGDTKWLSILKDEYKLERMSDSGFCALVEHPEIVQFVFSKGIEGISLPKDVLRLLATTASDCGIGPNDLDVFINTLNNSRESKLHGHKSTLFRLHQLLDSPASKHCLNQIRERVLMQIQVYLKGKHLPRNKLVVTEFKSKVEAAKNVSEIYEIIEQYMSTQGKGMFKSGHNKLLNECMHIFRTYKDNPQVKHVLIKHGSK